MTLTHFTRVATFEFVNIDDPDYVMENPHVQAGLCRESVSWALTSTEYANWHPLTWLSLELDSSLYGVNPCGYHLTNVVLHTANTLLLFWALRAMTGAVARSGCVAALFAIHPLHVESVAWISERKDVLSALFWMLTLLSYAHYAARPSWGRYALVVAPFALGLTAKAMLVTLPCVLLLLDFWPLRRWPSGDHHEREKGRRGKEKGECNEREKGRRGKGEEGTGLTTHPSPLTTHRLPLTTLIVEKLPLLALSAACSVMTTVAQSKEAIVSIDECPLTDRLMNAAVAYAAYLAKAVWPLELAAFYPYTKPTAPVALAIATLLAAATVWTCRRWRAQPYLAMGWFWYLGTLVPVIGLVQIGGQALADRYTYVPLIGVFIAAVWGLADLARNGLVSRNLIAALGAVALAGFGLCTWVQVGYWHDSVSLWEHSLEVTGPNHVACAELGIALRERGLFKEALPWLQSAAKLAPEYRVARENLGLVLFKLARDVESKHEYEAVLRINPSHARAHRMLAMLLDAEGQAAAARSHLERSLRLAPDEWQTHWVLGELLVREGQAAVGERHLSEAARLNPSVGAAIAAGRSAFDRGPQAGLAEQDGGAEK